MTGLILKEHELVQQSSINAGDQGMNNAASEKRRSDRVWLTIPVRVRGVDSNGEAVELTALATGLNRYGGRIQVSRELDCARSIRLRKPIGNFEVELRV